MYFEKGSTVIQSRGQGYIPKGEEHVHQADPDTEPLITSQGNEQGLDCLAKTENIPAGLSPSVVILLCYRKEYRTHEYSHQHIARKSKWFYIMWEKKIKTSTSVHRSKQNAWVEPHSMSKIKRNGMEIKYYMVRKEESKDKSLNNKKPSRIRR